LPGGEVDEFEMADGASVGVFFAEAAHGFFFDAQVVGVAGEGVIGVPPVAYVVDQCAVGFGGLRRDGDRDLDGEACGGRVRYVRLCPDWAEQKGEG
jgi:hypothetical protein